MATPLKRVPPIEPSTDFPTLTDVAEGAPTRGSRSWIVVLVAAGALLVGSIGYAIGRESAGTPTGCERAVILAERATSIAISDLRTVRDGMLVFLDGELSEAQTILADARLGVEDLERLQADLAAAAESCLGG
jgi:hypothetical protein